MKKRRIIFVLAVFSLVGLAAFYFFSRNSTKTSAAWYGTAGWAYRQKITIDHTRVSGGPHSSFPVLVDVTDVKLKLAQKSGNDFLFTSDDGSTKLGHEIESYDSNTGHLVAWVNATSVSSSTDTILYVYYGNPSATDQSNKNGTWNANYTAVLHMGDATTSTVTDSTSVGTNGTKASADNPAAVVAKIGNGQYFNDDTADYITLTDTTALNWTPVTQGRTLSFWYYPTVFPAADSWYEMGFIKTTNSGGNRYAFGHWQGTAEGHTLYVSVYNNGWGYVEGFGATWTPAPSLNTWYHITIVASTAGNNKIFVNGVALTVADTTWTDTTAIDPSTTDIKSSAGYSTGQAVFDEYKISDTARSEGWVITEYNNQNSPRTFLSLDEQEHSLDPVYYWKFDDGWGQTASDSGTFKTNLNLTNTAWQTRDQCVSGKCLFFNGSSSVASTPLTVPNVKTVSFWFKPTSSVTNSLVDLNDANTITATNSAVTANGFSSPTIYVNGSVGATLISDQWNHIEITTATAIEASVFKIGQVGAGYTTGFIDEVKIYNYVRTAAQVKVDYNKDANSLSSYPTNPLNKGLAGYWKMDEATWSGTLAEVKDFSGNGGHGQAQGGVADKPFPQGGKFGAGGFFDGGDDYVSSTTQFSPESVTIAVWFNPMSASDQPLVTNTDVSCSNIDKRYYLATTRFIFKTSGGCATLSQIDYTPTVGSWNFVVATYNMETFDQALYLNGTLVEKVNTGAVNPWYQDQGYVNFGTNFSVDSFFSGSMDEVRIYDRALTAADVSQLYNFAPGSVAYWNFEEGSGGVVADTSGYSNNTVWHGTGKHWTSGKYGKAGLFDGSSDHTYIADTDYLDMGHNSFSFSLWLKTTQTGVQSTILGKYNDGGSETGYAVVLETSNYIGFRVSSGVDASGRGYWHGAKTVNDGKWHHVEVIADRTLADPLIYIDGVADAITNNLGNDMPGSIINIVSSLETEVGYHSNNPGNVGTYLNGSVDEVKIYNYARTVKQIMEDMNADHPAPGSPVGSAIGYWKFDEGTGTVARDSSSQGNNGTISGGTWSQNGKFGKALSSGAAANYVEIPNESTFDFTGAMSISVWIKVNAFNINWQSLVTKGDSAWRIARNSGNDVLDWTTDGLSTAALVGNTAVNDNKWHHVVGIYDGAGNKYLYIDGKLDNAATGLTGAISTNNYKVWIGNNAESTSRGWNGLIDEVKIYNFALTSSEVLTEYNHGSAIVLGAISDTSQLTGGSIASNSASAAYCVPGDTTSCVPPVGEWNFEDGSGASVTDNSGNNNTGAWTGTGVRWAPGKYGKAGYFNGTSDYLTLTSDPIVNLTSGTIEFWIKFPTTYAPGSGAYYFPFEKEPGIHEVNVYTDGVSGVMHFRIRHNSTFSTDISTKTTTWTGNTWYHIAVQWSNSTGTAFYVNGKLETTGGNDTITSTSGSFFIGAASTVPDYPLLGSLDQFRVFNYKRTPAQIAWDYNRGAPVGYWKFNECTGTTLHDSGSGTNSATLSIGGAGADQTSAGTCNDSLSTSAWYNGATGKYNGSIYLDGADDKATVTTGLNRIQSVSFWTKPASSSGTIPFIALATSPAINVTSSNLAVSATGWTTPTIYINGKVGTALTANAWNHVVVTSATPNSANAITFGYISPTYFKGQLDEVKIWNYALTSSQIRIDYNQGSAVRL